MSTQTRSFKITKRTTKASEILEVNWSYSALKAIAKASKIKVKDLSKEWDDAIDQISIVLQQKNKEELITIKKKLESDGYTRLFPILLDRIRKQRTSNYARLDFDVKITYDGDYLPFYKGGYFYARDLAFRLIAFYGQNNPLLKEIPSLSQMKVDYDEIRKVHFYLVYENSRKRLTEGKMIILLEEKYIPEIPLNIEIDSTAW